MASRDFMKEWEKRGRKQSKEEERGLGLKAKRCQVPRAWGGQEGGGGEQTAQQAQQDFTLFPANGCWSYLVGGADDEKVLRT